MKLSHLTDQDHVEAARLLNEIQNNLRALTSIVGRAPWTDCVLRVMKAVQERLIDPLDQARESNRDRNQIYTRDDIYPSVHYSVKR